MTAEAIPRLEVGMAYPEFLLREEAWTEEAYLEIPPGGPKIELVDGDLVMSPSARKLHQRLMRRLANVLEANAPEDLAIEVELNVKVGPRRILIPDVVATYEQGDQLIHSAEHVLLVAEVVSPSNQGPKWFRKGYLYATAGIPWFLLVEIDDEGRPTLILRRREGRTYVEHARVECGESLKFPDPLGEVDPSDLLKRRP